MKCCYMKNSPQANIDILRHMLKYCNRIEAYIERFGNDLAVFKDDMAYRDSVGMNILQIGELAGHLSDDYRAATSDKMPWRSIRAMRNLFAHDYGQMNVEIMWSTAIESIPQLKTFCEEQIKNAELLQMDSIDYLEEDEDALEI